MTKSITPLIVGAMVLGVIAGLIIHAAVSPEQLGGFTTVFGVFTDVFLRLIRMIIGPLVLSTLTVGIARMGDATAIGRIGLKAMAWFIVAAVVAFFVALLVAETFHPGAGMHLTEATAAAAQGAQANLTLQSFIQRIFPTSLFDALARNEVLQIVVFSLFAGIACSQLHKEHRDRVIDLLDAIAAIMLKMTNYVMWISPVAVFAALASATSRQGFGVIETYAGFILEVYLAIAILWALLILVAYMAVGGRVGALMRAVRSPALIAFSTTSSEAAYPSLLANLEMFGVPNRIASFVLPLGYAFNLIGSMVYATMATMFAANAYDIAMPPSQIFLMGFLLFIASKGIAMVPRASLLVVVATLPYLKIPEAAFPLLLAVDQIVDMGRTCTNTVACAIATTTVARWEGAIKQPVASGDVEVAVTK
jgi:Na+/H+-dicarboxylate symporter